MQFSLDFTDIISQFLLNCALYALFIWAILRVPEKVCDILLKYQQYERAKEGER